MSDTVTRGGLYSFIDKVTTDAVVTENAFANSYVHGSEGFGVTGVVLSEALRIASAYNDAADRIVAKVNEITFAGTDTSTAPYWPTNLPEDTEERPLQEPPTGFNCSRCNERNEYASSNHPDGTYVCYRCR